MGNRPTDSDIDDDYDSYEEECEDDGWDDADVSYPEQFDPLSQGY